MGRSYDGMRDQRFPFAPQLRMIRGSPAKPIRPCRIR